MRFTKSLLVAFAGLGLFACSNDDDVTKTMPEGNGAVTVKIMAPQARGLETPTPGNGNITVGGGDLTVKLTHNGGEMTAIVPAEQVKGGEALVKFWNVTNPTKLTVSRNGGKAGDKTTTEITDLQQEAELIPVYGETTTFTPTAENDKPNADDAIVDEGDNDGDDKKVFQMYTANVDMTIPVGRLEISGIKHVKHPAEKEDKCKFTTLTIDGIYLDNVKKTANGTVTDYYFDAEAEQKGATGTAEAILKDAISAQNNNFMTPDAVWPAVADNQCYAYNFFPGANKTENPILKIYFKTATGADTPVSQPRYAVIENYKNESGDPITLEAGKIYRITDATLYDKNITGSEGGETLYGVTVTVTEATWTPVDITVDWKE